jgi:hypothetical protein
MNPLLKIERIGLVQPEKRKRVENVCVKENLIHNTHITSTSPSGNLRLDVDQYTQGKSLWKYSGGIVTDISHHQVIAEIKRNYGHFWHTWVNHPNGHEYLLFGEDYQGYSLIDIEKGITHVYLPQAAENGGGFCWIAVYPSSDKLVLAVEGCYWACEYEVVFVDFSNPTVLPYQEIGRISAGEKVIGWDDNDTFSVSCQIMFRKSDHKKWSELSDEEQLELLKNESLVEYESKTLLWKRSARKEEIVEIR